MDSLLDEMVRAALGWAFAQALQLEFTGDVKDAWLALIEEVNTAMKAGAMELATPAEGQ